MNTLNCHSCIPLLALIEDEKGTQQCAEKGVDVIKQLIGYSMCQSEVHAVKLVALVIDEVHCVKKLFA